MTENNNRKIIIVSYTDTEGTRLSSVSDFFVGQGYDVTLLCSDFNHRTKSYFKSEEHGAVQLHVRTYRKNFSASRILSCRDYSRAALRYLEALEEEPYLIYAKTPTNFVFKYMAEYKKHHPRVRLIFDVFDLWPETFPVGKLKKLLSIPFSVWRNLRTKNIEAADRVITECSRYNEVLKLPSDYVDTIYLCEKALDLKALESRALENEAVLGGTDSKTFNLCYLGQINNVIDIPFIAGFLEQLSAGLRDKGVSTVLHIIGGGERTEEFIRTAEDVGVQVNYHGPIYDDPEKYRIIRTCRFGLNMVKESSFIGLTMKSVDYLKFGLPLLNNVPADSYNLVEKEGCGINVGREDEAQKSAVDAILKMDDGDFDVMNEKARNVFSKHFSREAIMEQYQSVLKKL